MNQKPSFSPTFTGATVTLICCAIILSSGCRNCNQACTGNGYAYSPTIAPPPTYSLQIPSANGNPAYYVPGSPNPNATANLPSYLVNPNLRAPTPAVNNGGTNINQQNGWRPTGNNNLSSGNSATSPNTVAQTPIGLGIAPLNRVASAPTAQSVVTSVDYVSTGSNEQLDPTRLPATDASNVRATAGFVNNGSATRLAQAQPAPASAYSNNYNQAVAFNQPAPSVYSGTPVIAQQPAQQFYYGTPTVRQSAPTVLAQSTATGIPSSTGGWTDRELTASRSELNR